MSIQEKLATVQDELKVPKNQFNAFGGFAYRSKEDILEAVKPIAKEVGCVVLVDDESVMIGEWHYIKSRAALIDLEEMDSISAHGWAREPDQAKGMNTAQITGIAASYAGKRALGNLLAIDDSVDADQPPAHQKKEPPETGQFVARCSSCGTAYTFDSKENYEAFVASAACCQHPDWEVQ